MTGMHVLKGIVILGGVLLVAGSILLFMRVSQHTPATAQPIAPTTLTLARGNRVQNILTTSQGLALWAGDANGNAELLFLDANGNLRKHLIINRQESEKVTAPHAPQTPKN
ncbi:MAG: hypothetical protein HQL83_01740 [Magnetococcales bacterium]|nr:hypothetical protein [Magnetococcales bacterium]MBF0347945.1 hypothetical protein [Magnetococcales bacterium]MBF0632937.1 hypothetical protein [Magnetococcales bacterium]